MPQKLQADCHQHQLMQIYSLPTWDHWQYFSKLAHDGYEAVGWNNQLVSSDLATIICSFFQV